MLEKSYIFLKNLKENNNREWYHANKGQYNEAREEFEHLIELLIHEIAVFDKGIAGLQPKNCIFRIYRDVRFSHDKSPYKTNFGSFMCPGGKKSMSAGYYLHIAPDESFVAGGVYMPPSPVLKAIRREIYEHIDEFKEIIHHPSFKKHYPAIDGDALKTAPQGFPKDFPDIDLLRFKSYTVFKSKTEKAMLKEKILGELCEEYKAMYPFNRFLNQAIENSY